MDILTRINWVDILVLIVIIRISYVALREGLSHEIFPLLGSVLMVFLSLHYYNKIGLFICQNIPGMPIELAELLSFVALIIAAGAILKVLKFLLDKIIKVQWHPLIEKFGGLAAGLARAAITASIILMILMLLPFSYLQKSIRDRSMTGNYFLKIGPEIYEKAGWVTVNKDEIMKRLTSDKYISVTKRPEDRTEREE